MRITIAPKLFLGFVVIILLNVFFFVIVSNLEDVSNIANLLKRESEIKNNLIRLKTLHRIQAPSIVSFERLGRLESVDNFFMAHREFLFLIDTISLRIDSLGMILLGKKKSNMFSQEQEAILSPLRSNIELIRKYDTIYISLFNNIVSVKTSSKPLSQKAAENWRNQINETGGKITKSIDSLESIVDLQTNQYIKEVELRIKGVRSKTIYIITGVTVIAMIFGLWFSTYITNSLRRLKTAAAIIGRGEFNVDPHVYPNDEIGDLAAAFFQMSIDLKNAQESLIRSKRLAAIGEIVASVNHEINNPLMIISGNAQFLKMMMTKYPQEMQERIQTILEETERISQVTKKLREIKNPIVEDYTSSGEQMINLDKSSS